MFLAVFLFCGTVGASNISVVRTLPASITPGETFTVILEMNTSGPFSPSAGMKEYLPIYWTVSAISYNGTYYPASMRVDWLFWQNGYPVTNQTITYNLTAPSNATTTNLSGTFYDSVLHNISGDLILTIAAATTTTTTTEATTSTTTNTTTTTTTSGSTTSTTLAAFLSNVSISPIVHLNDVVSASVYLTNSNGPLEGQDCSVVSYFNGTMLHDYHTLCQYAPQIICGLLSESGGCNYAAITNCSFTDSVGGYYFVGRTDESLGYSWNGTYEIRFTCNGKNSSGYFTTVLDKQPDTNKMEAFLNQYGGMIVLGILGIGAFLVFAVIVVSLFSWAWHRGRKKR